MNNDEICYVAFVEASARGNNFAEKAEKEHENHINFDAHRMIVTQDTWITEI